MKEFKAKLLRSAATRDNAFVRRMPAGIPGAFSRGLGLCTVEPQVITPSSDPTAPTSYGLAVQIDADTGQVRMINNTDTDAYGVLMRPYPTNSGNDGLGVSTPPARGVVDVMPRGYASVKLNGATAAKKGGTVYVWFAASAGQHVQGGFEAGATGGSTLALPDKWYFTGPADPNGNVEIGVNI